MKKTVLAVAAVVVLGASLVAQENKPVPKDSVRVYVPGCTRGAIFTAGPRTEDQPARFGIPEGMHLRMNGPKKVMSEIKAHEGSMIEITGLMKKGQYGPEGVNVGGGVRITPGPAGGGSLGSTPVMTSLIYIDVEGWRPAAGSCPSR